MNNVIKVIHESNAEALRFLDPSKHPLINWECTALFIDYMLQFCHILIVKPPAECIDKRLPDCVPIRSVNDHQMYEKVCYLDLLLETILFI